MIQVRTYIGYMKRLVPGMPTEKELLSSWDISFFQLYKVWAT